MWSLPAGNCQRLVRGSHPPRGLAKAGESARAAAGVYRNAAVAFKSLADVDGDQRQARSNKCGSAAGPEVTITSTYSSPSLAKKPGDATP